MQTRRVAAKLDLYARAHKLTARLCRPTFADRRGPTDADRHRPADVDEQAHHRPLHTFAPEHFEVLPEAAGRRLFAQLRGAPPVDSRANQGLSKHHNGHRQVFRLLGAVVVRSLGAIVCPVGRRLYGSRVAARLQLHSRRRVCLLLELNLGAGVGAGRRGRAPRALPGGGRLAVLASISSGRRLY